MLKNSHVVLLKLGSKIKGGLEKYTSRIASAFLSKGAQVTFLSTGEAPLDTKGVDFHSFPVKSAFSFRKLNKFDRAVEKWLQTHPADIIFGMDRNRTQTHLRAGNGVHAAFLKSRLFTEGKMKYYASLINPLHQTILSLERQGFCNPRLRKLFTNSNMVRQELLDHYPVDPNKIEVIHNGVEWKEMEDDFINWEKGKEEAFKKYELDPDLFHIIFIGHGFLRKGLNVLIEALHKWKFRDFHLSVIGNERRLDEYKSKVKKLQMEEKIRFFGPQTTTSFYQMADTLAIPSFYDPFANVTVEALAMGLFVISSKHNGGHEILNRKNGAVIENLSNPESILKALNEALQNKKTKQSSLEIRQTVSHLDFSCQLTKLIDACE